jgi:hypothetical protein
MKMMPSMDVCRRIETMARQDAHQKQLGPWSTGEKIAVCLVLDRADWLKKMDYTMLEAIDRLGEDWLDACQFVRKMWNATDGVQRENRD